jgi:glucose/arabinose dehydrogenase
MTQAVFGPDGRLYVSTLSGRVRALPYGPDGVTGGYVNVATNVGVSLLGIAFDENGVLYASGNWGTSNDGSGFLARLRDINGDGIYETREHFITHLPTAAHHNNQLVIDGQTLYFGMGSRTDDGLEDGLLDLLSLMGSLSGMGSSPGGASGQVGPGLLGAGLIGRVLPHPNGVATATVQRVDLGQVDYTSDLNVPRLHARGLRNAYGIALDEEGRVWVGDNGPDEVLQLPDELHLVKPGKHHGFPPALAPSDAVACVADMGCGTSADGLTVYPTGGGWGLAYEGDIFIARFVIGINGAAGEGKDVVRVELSGPPNNPTGTATVFANDFNGPLDVRSTRTGT